MFNTNNKSVLNNIGTVQQQMAPASPAAAPRRQHPHFCLFGIVHLATAMKLIIIFGLLVIAALCALEAIYLRRALTVMGLPLAVSLVTLASMCRSDPRLLWPIVGISFFHLFLAGYVTIVFLFIFFLKPIYIIMVLNWAFDTLHTTTKTVQFYSSCAILFAALLAFFGFNLWQLRTALRFQTFLDELGSGTSSASSGSTSSSCASSEQQQHIESAPAAPKGKGRRAETAPAVPAKISEPFAFERCAVAAASANVNNAPPSPHQCCSKLLNEPPIVLLNDAANSCGSAGGAAAGIARRRSRSPGARRNAHSVQQQQQQPMLRVPQHPPPLNGIYAQLGGAGARRPSLRDDNLRHFGTAQRQ